MARLTVRDLGHVGFSDAFRLQTKLVERVQADRDQAYLLLLEHDPPVVTLGKSAKAEHVLASAEQLAAAGVEVHKTTRGGDVTYHGPGQLVGYPILRIRDVRKYLRDLEEVLIRALARFGIGADRRQGSPADARSGRFTGVWVGDEKIAAIGVAVRRWVTYHGFALNVAPDMAHFDLIVPCGLHGHPVTSLAQQLGRRITVEEVRPVVVECFVEAFGFEDVQTDGNPG